MVVRVLVRFEQVTGGAGHQRVVWFDTDGISTTVSDASFLEVTPRETGGLGPMPIELVVTLSGSDGTVIWSRRVQHHQEVTP